MKKSTRMIALLLALVGWAAAGVGVAHAGVILPVDVTTTTPLYPPITGASVTVSILDQNGVDVTDTWLPEWNPAGGVVGGATPTVFSVFVVINSGGVAVTPSSISLVSPPASITFDGTTNPFLNASTLTTSAYSGQCTNFGSSTDLTPDFDFSTTGTTVPNTTKTGFLLTPRDCGGMAVITVTVDGAPFTFILPQDSNGNGIPDIFEATFCPSNSCPTGREEADTSAGSSITGDGFFAFDEYRGFIASGTHVRTDPRQKDLFVHLVNPQCVAGDPLLSTASLLGGPNSVVSGNPLFSNVGNLISGTRIHRLGYETPNAPHLTTNEWVDDFHHYSLDDGLRFGDGTTSTAPATDRQVNQNAVYFNVDSGINVPQKGLRIIECLDTSTPSLLGFASLGSPNGPDNAVLFTQNIVNYFTNSLEAVCETPTTPCLSYSTFQNGAWTTPVAISPVSLFGVAFAFYLAMEIGHTVQLTPTVEGTKKTSYGYHHAPGTGSNLDQAITNKISNKTGNTFYIPLLYNTSDLENYNLK
ncbi:MAG: hypothetical protein HY729_07020 [Candidatus Rokubacteria bacterium]|nr:hypothetical protein [Candidatus Rokubacteria bacterium]